MRMREGGGGLGGWVLGGGGEGGVVREMVWLRGGRDGEFEGGGGM